jgi:hypothetical protein
LICEYLYENIRFNLLKFTTKYSLQNICFETKRNLKTKYSLQFASIHFKYSIPFICAPVPVHVCVRVCVHVLRGHRHAAWMQTNSIGMHIQRGLGHEAWTWTIGHTECTHAAWTWRCSMDMDMQRGHGHRHAA